MNMREIKFRAWDLISARMSDVIYIAFDFTNGKDIQDIAIANNTEKGGYNRDVRRDGYDLVLMQFTGLKDRNGKEIYEGDIVRVSAHMKPTVFSEPKEVRWDEKNLNYKGIYPSLEPWSVHEVIGNIYENPELLKES